MQVKAIVLVFHVTMVAHAEKTLEDMFAPVHQAMLDPYVKVSSDELQQCYTAQCSYTIIIAQLSARCGQIS